MPVVVKNQEWVIGVYDPSTGKLDTTSEFDVSAKFPITAFPDGYLKLEILARDDEWGLSVISALKSDGSIYNKILTPSEGNIITVDAQTMSDWEMVYIEIKTSQIFDLNAPQWASEHVTLTMSPNYFPESALGIYITSQQLIQFKNMYPDCVSDAYRTAIGELTANIGNRFDMSAILDQTDEDKKDDTIRWILLVLTAYNIASPSLNYTEPLANAYQKVAETIIKLKGGMVSLEEPAPYRTDACNANSEVITSRYNYLG